METPPIRPKRPSFESLRAARLAAIQALFQIEYTSEPLADILSQFLEHRFIGTDYPLLPDAALFEALVSKVMERQQELMAIINEHLNEPWTYTTLQPVLREIIKAGTLELIDPITAVPAPVIITEYTELTEGFLSLTEASLTNAVLDGVAKTLGLKLKK